jgi:sortase A
MLAICFGARMQRVVLSRRALARFHTEQASPSDRPSRLKLTAAKADFRLWSLKRVQEYEDSLTARLAPAIRILSMTKIHLDVPVLEGTDDLTLKPVVLQVRLG